MHHPKANVDRLYIPRNEERRGMILLELSYKTSTIGQHGIPYNNNRLDATTHSQPWQNKKSSLYKWTKLQE